jgi:cytochrome c oxidase cbb3-type subunit 3
MSDFASGFWDLYIGIITVISIIACGVLLWAQSVQRTSGSETSGHVWDEDIREYNNPLPRWWMWLFYITIVFSFAYLALYPGLGSFKGMLGWSQVKQLADENAQAQSQFGPLYARLAAKDVVELAKDPEAMAIGQRLFLNSCAQCHASDGGGSRGFPNLTDKDWLWGGTPEAIKQTIAEGRSGVMPPWGPAIGDEGVKNVTAYLMQLSGNAYDSLRAYSGREIYAKTCVACHGADGKGNQALGAPNLSDKIWLYGSGEAIQESISRGRNGQMPAHKDLLSPEKIHLLTAYVYSLGGAQAPPPK